MSEFEMEFWGSCANTWHEEQKQFAYAKRMGLQANWGGAHPPTYDIGGSSVLDIGGGPVSLLLKCVDRGECIVADPAEWPAWVRARYSAHGIDYWRMRGEELVLLDGVERFDEAWIYNVLQHVNSPALVIDNAFAWADTVRLFEWVDVPSYPGHPQMLTQELLERWLGAPGFVSQLAENGAVGRAFYGVFSTP